MFWAMNPREFKENSTIVDDVNKQKDTRAAAVACTVLNAQGGKKGNVPYTPSDIFPSLATKADEDIDATAWAAWGSSFERR